MISINSTSNQSLASIHFTNVSQGNLQDKEQAEGEDLQNTLLTNLCALTAL